MSNPANSPPCQFFLRGACLFGDKCTKRHPLDAKPTPKPCPYFVRGTCRFGIRCSNSHEASPKEARAAVPTSTFNGTWGTTTQPCRHHGAGFCRNGSSCRFVHESVANPVRITFEASKMKDISQVF
ncbi:hypothetical protein DL96DRAFT_1477482 [Flagelloscypha sp. PMI_526]|nr:hypothetical protein DL96DRAFT_1477482 [Flagelloscypha sp. PMI_526]